MCVFVVADDIAQSRDNNIKSTKVLKLNSSTFHHFRLTLIETNFYPNKMLLAYSTYLKMYELKELELK